MRYFLFYSLSILFCVGYIAVDVGPKGRECARVTACV